MRRKGEYCRVAFLLHLRHRIAANRLGSDTVCLRRNHATTTHGATTGVVVPNTNTALHNNRAVHPGADHPEVRHIRKCDVVPAGVLPVAGAMDTREAVIQRIGELRERGLSATSVNTHLRVVNAFFTCMEREHQSEPTPGRIPRLKEPQKVLATFTPEQVARIISYRPRGRVIVVPRI